MSLQNNLWSLLFPGKCVSCGEHVSMDTRICDKCKEGLHRISAPYCPYCGVSKADCKCKKQMHAYEEAIAPFYYEDAARNAILRLKFKKCESVASFFAPFMVSEIESRYFGIKFDVLTCVPMSKESFNERGFNQSELLAREIASSLGKNPGGGIVTDYTLLVKKEASDMQHMLGAQSRKDNIKGAYKLGKNRDVEGKTILLIDDILTTGATANECAVILRLCGAKAVYVACATITRNTGTVGSKKSH